MQNFRNGKHSAVLLVSDLENGAMSTALKTWRIQTEMAPKMAARTIGVSLPTWSRWENGRRPIPPMRVLDIERLTGISRHELRPDLFGPPPQLAEGVVEGGSGEAAAGHGANVTPEAPVVSAKTDDSFA